MLEKVVRVDGRKDAIAQSGDSDGWFVPVEVSMAYEQARPFVQLCAADPYA
jgi:hypothetical protein